jgi:SAM-dependent methyltransferase
MSNYCFIHAVTTPGGTVAGSALYDEIGVGYARFRRPDPRIESAIHAALGRAQTVVNVGAGTGSYEPRAREVLAVEPSAEMIRQRPASAAPCVQGDASPLPFDDLSFDAAMAVLTVHHWPRPRRGLREMSRVARGVVVLAFDPAIHNDFWLFRDYVPAVPKLRSNAGAISVDEIADIVDADRIEPVLVPHDCMDGFGVAYWRRPSWYLDPDARRCISSFGLLGPEDTIPGVERLRDDLDTGRWHRRYRELLDLDVFDAGLRLVVRDVE